MNYCDVHNYRSEGGLIAYEGTQCPWCKEVAKLNDQLGHAHGRERNLAMDFKNLELRCEKLQDLVGHEAGAASSCRLERLR